MKCIIRIFSLLAFFAPISLVAQQAKTNYNSFANSKELHRFYSYGKQNVAPIIQGHRGTQENGFPESSIVAFEHVLQSTPAVFEMDPRLTKDSVIVVFHDATLERCSNGNGKVSDYTWKELQKLRLKNASGELTEQKIPTLAQVLEWAKGKTALVLDKKDVPMPMIADMIRKHKANSYVINMVRSTEEALFYYNEDPSRMLSVSIRTPEVFRTYVAAGIPKTQMFACIGTELNEGTAELCKLLSENGIRSLLATASSYDKLTTAAQRAEAYRRAIEAGVSIIESDKPMEVAATLLNKL